MGFNDNYIYLRILVLLERKQAQPGAAHVDGKNCPGLQLRLHLLQSVNDPCSYRFRSGVIGPDLNHARLRFLGDRQDGTEIGILRKNDKAVLARINGNFGVSRRRMADLGPMLSLDAGASKKLHPAGPQIHVDQQFHASARTISRSLARQAA